MSEEKKLTIKYSGRIIDLLGIQMYQSVVAAVAEIISNAWDADAEKVQITLPETLNEDSCITIKDDGIGMSFKDCQERYLNVGYCRRGTDVKEKTPEKKRPVLGRKGIGKFAGFGIAQIIKIKTVSKVTRELIEFELDLNELRGVDYVSENESIKVLKYTEQSLEKHGTTIELKCLKISREPVLPVFIRSMSRRFLLHQRCDDFKVFINEKSLPDCEDSTDIEFSFPKDLPENQKENVAFEADWGLEELSDGNIIKWKICFYKKTINEEQLRGVSIFSHGKLSQSPFFFNLTGGLGGQHGQQYISGSIEADYLDEQEMDLISPERQRIDFEREETEPLLKWGQEKIKFLLKLWQEKRAEEYVALLEQKMSPFKDRIDKLSSSERKTVKKALLNLAKIPTIEKENFISLSNSILLTWEEGRLKELINDISENDSLNEQDFLKLLLETQVLTALNIAEAVKTKILAIIALKDFIKRRDTENKIRDHIANNPWLISSEWETFKVEKTVMNIMKDAAKNAELGKDIYNGRIDLALSSGNQLLILEFMRPGLPVDIDHCNRFQTYIYQIREAIEINTAVSFNSVIGYLVADSLSKNAGLSGMIKGLEKNQMYSMDWSALLGSAIKQYEEYLDILKSRSPNDERLENICLIS